MIFLICLSRFTLVLQDLLQIYGRIDRANRWKFKAFHIYCVISEFVVILNSTRKKLHTRITRRPCICVHLTRRMWCLRAKWKGIDFFGSLLSRVLCVCFSFVPSWHRVKKNVLFFYAELRWWWISSSWSTYLRSVCVRQHDKFEIDK